MKHWEKHQVMMATLKKSRSAGYQVYNPEGHTVHRLRVFQNGGEENLRP
jgi:hypothetical protein